MNNVRDTITTENINEYNYSRNMVIYIYKNKYRELVLDRIKPQEIVYINIP